MRLFTIGFLVFPLWVMAAPAQLIELREAVREMAKSKACVNCHLPGQRGALQRILDVYNLKNTHWTATLDDGRLIKFRERMRDELDERDFGLVETFVQKELAYRKSNPEERLGDIERNKQERALNELGILRLVE